MFMPFNTNLGKTWGLTATIFAFIIALCLYFNNGHFTYTLDDAYIHLSLSEGLFRGHHGINPGEVSSPSSSIMWPFLLMWAAPLPIHYLLPLIINFIVLLAAATLLYQLCNRCGFMETSTGRRNTIWLIPLLLVAFNFYTTAFTGMEAALQMLLALASAYGMILMAEEEQHLPWWSIAAVILGPLVRFESLAIVLPFCLFLLWRRRFILCALVLATVTAATGAYMYFLTTLGLPPLPSSVMVKLSVSGHSYVNQPDTISFINLWQRFALNFRYASFGSPEASLGAMTVALSAAGFFLTTSWKKRLLCLTPLYLFIAHTAGGAWGGYPRYASYVIASGGLIALWVWHNKFKNPLNTVRTSLIIPSSAIILGGLFYAPNVVKTITIPIASNNIYQQHYQIHRFLTNFHNAPVAVHDIGYASYRNENYVLDLVGLASEKVRLARYTSGKNWLQTRDKLYQTYNIPLVISHAAAAKNYVPANATVIGRLFLSNYAAAPTDTVTDFFALPGHKVALTKKIKAFAPSVPLNIPMMLRREKPSTMP